MKKPGLTKLWINWGIEYGFLAALLLLFTLPIGALVVLVIGGGLNCFMRLTFCRRYQGWTAYVFALMLTLQDLLIISCSLFLNFAFLGVKVLQGTGAFAEILRGASEIAGCLLVLRVCLLILLPKLWHHAGIPNTELADIE